MNLFKLEMQTFNLRDMFKKWIENIVIQAELKQLKFQIEIEQDVPLVVESDHHKIQNVLLNLIGNSIKNTSEGFIKV